MGLATFRCELAIECRTPTPATFPGWPPLPIFIEKSCLMPSSHFAGETMRSVLTAIIRGQPWKASSVPHPILRKNFRRLGRSFCASRTTVGHLVGPCLRLLPVVVERSHLLSTRHVPGRHLIPALLRIAAYSDRWIRSPDDWVPASDNHFGDLLRHLFVRWEIPLFFDSAWLEKGSLKMLERDWYCEIGTGGSWRECEGMPLVPKKAIHLAMRAPKEMTVREALRWGQMKALKLPDDLIPEVLSSVVVKCLSNEEIWTRLLAKLADAPDFKAKDFGMLADFFHAHYRTCRFNRARDLVALPLHELVRSCWKFWRTLYRNAGADGLSFRSDDLHEPGLRDELWYFCHSSWGRMEDVEDGELCHRDRCGRVTKWRIRQLVKYSQLLVEGQRMQHCVGSYRRDCLSGKSAIFSLGLVHQVDGICERVEPRVTIEVCRHSKWVLQARAKWNAVPGVTESEVLARWGRKDWLRGRLVYSK